ncbi:MAG: pyrroline-5-carboxylate reductase [Eubacterium sp.]
MSIGFIGCGNMASAIIKGITANKTVIGDKIFVYDIYAPALDNAVKTFGAEKCANEAEAAQKSDIVILAVKPNILQSVLEKISEYVNSDTLIISIAAGKSINFISSYLKEGSKIVRVMPNINAKVSEAISAYCCNSNVSENDKKEVERLLSGIGKVISLDESYFPLFGVLGGCSPAFVYMFIDALARAGVKNGMKKDDALKIAAQAVYGSAKMILESDNHPWDLIDKVCSPGGTTIEGVTSLQSDGFESAIHNAVDKVLDKDKRL